MIEVKLSAYRNAVKGGCAALHSVAKAAHKPGMAHLYHAVEALERRCKRLERVANSQLHAMVSEPKDNALDVSVKEVVFLMF